VKGLKPETKELFLKELAKGNAIPIDKQSQRAFSPTSPTLRDEPLGQRQEPGEYNLRPSEVAINRESNGVSHFAEESYQRGWKRHRFVYSVNGKGVAVLELMEFKALRKQDILPHMEPRESSVIIHIANTLPEFQRRGFMRQLVLAADSYFPEPLKPDSFNTAEMRGMMGKMAGKEVSNPKRKGDNKGININDEFQDFTGQILRGEKTIETRPSRSLDSRIGKLTGIIRTGIRNQKATLVGYMVIGEPVVYDSVAKFRKDQSKHLVAPGSVHDIKNGLKYGYPIMQVEPVTPRVITSSGRVIRQLNPAKRNPVVFPPDDITFAGASSTPANDAIAAGKALWDTHAFKKWFGDSKVRDLAKRPMVVYHGTCSAEFTEFDPTKTQEVGFHFGTSLQAKDFLKGCGSSRGKVPGIYPVYLSIQNPIFTPDVYSEDPIYLIQWLEKTNHIHEWFPDENDSYYRSMNRLRDQMASLKSDSTLSGKEQYEMLKPLRKATSGLLRKVIMRKGYDGIRYKNENEGRTDDPTNIAWIAFSPAQVKSATENIRTFDRRDPDIRNPASRTVDEAAKKAGYTTKAFHRTSAKFTKFIPGGPKATGQIWRTKSGESRTLFGQSGRAMWFGTSPDNLPAYHNDPAGKGVVLMVYLKNPNPLQIDDDTRDWARDVYADGSKEFPLLLSDEHIRNIRGDGYTGIEYWRKGKTAEKSSPDEIVVFDANQIKSADLVTYDDAGNSIPISNRFSGKSDDIRNPRRSMIRTKLSRILEPGDRVLDYDRAQGEDLYRLWDMVHTDKPLTKEALVEIEGMLDDDGVLVIQSGEEPSGLKDHFRRATRYQGMLLVQGPLNPEVARINTEKLRRDLE
jgi:hypothetical protein